MPVLELLHTKTFDSQMECLRREFSDHEWPNGTSRDEFDDSSSHVILTVDGELAGLVRLTRRPPSVLSAWAVDEAELPGSRDAVEAGRGVVGRKWRGMGLYKLLMCEITFLCHRLGAPQVVAAVETDFPLLGFLECIGFRPVGPPIQFERPPKELVTCQVIVQEPAIALAAAWGAREACIRRLAAKGMSIRSSLVDGDCDSQLLQRMKGRASMEIGECRRQFDEEGTVVLAADEGPLDASQWNRLDALTAPGSLPFEHVELGDTGDRHRVEVGRFFTDSDRPRAVHSAAHDVLGVIDGPAMRRLHEELLGRTGLTIRRCQVNVLREGGFVGLHVDRDANPDYLAAVVLQLGKDYEGGDYVVHHDRHGTLGYRIPHHSILVSRCDLSHEVTPVTRGVRKTLVYFLAAHAGENRRRLVGDVGRG